MKTIKFYTLGCKVNQYDTQSIRERFVSAGFKEIHNGCKADYYLINTCTVTSVADRKSRSIIRSCLRANPRAKVIVTGCLVKNNSLALSGIKGVHLAVSKDFFPSGINNFSGHTRAFLKIQDGCDNFCSYCKVPYARGRSRSRPLCEITKDARSLAQSGFKEVVLCGVCLGSYGRDLNPQKNLVGVISALEKIKGIMRIRLSSIEAGNVSEDLIKKLASSKKLCRHLHIPIQSGSDAVLRKMNRSYTSRYYLNLIKRIRRAVPEIAITTDILLGFPGENEEDFSRTVKLAQKIRPLKVHIFPYSAREGTKAAVLPGRVPMLTVKRRIERLKKVTDKLALSYKSKFLGKKLGVLMESRSKENPDIWEGHTDNYLKVLYRSKLDLGGRVLNLELKEGEALKLK